MLDNIHGVERLESRAQAANFKPRSALYPTEKQKMMLCDTDSWGSMLVYAVFATALRSCAVGKNNDCCREGIRLTITV
jgi:hypothetical protein